MSVTAAAAAAAASYHPQELVDVIALIPTQATKNYKRIISIQVVHQLLCLSLIGSHGPACQ